MKKLGKTKEFTNQLKRINRSGINFKDVFKEVVDLLLNNKKLPAKYKDHKLKGELRIFRECHLKNDLLLVYKVEKDSIILIGIGTHSKIFK